MADQLDPDRIPRHIGIIMDGNGRWAGARGFERTVGHAAGEQSIFDTIDDCLELGVEWLTVYAFSTENWNRSDEEVDFLMAFNESLLVRHRDSVAEKATALAKLRFSEGYLSECTYSRSEGLLIAEFHNPLANVISTLVLTCV